MSEMTVMNAAEQKQIQLDRMRYTKNTLSSRLTLLAIVFDVLYFVSIYSSDVGKWYYSGLIGISIVYNLLFMLLAFLASEGVKNYHIGYSWLLLGLAVGQVVRIFILPMQALNATVKIKSDVLPVMQTPQFLYVVVMLALSAICCLIAGLAGIKRSRTLEAYNASLSEKAA